MRAGRLPRFGHRSCCGSERFFERAAAGTLADAVLCVRDGKKILGTHWIVPMRRTPRSGVGRVDIIFRFAPLANRHAGSLFTYSTCAQKTGLTKVKNFSDEGLRVSRGNDFSCGRNEFP